MSGKEAYIFVFWGERFEEVAASIFVTELRAAGLPVKLVSLARQHSAGMHGLSLVPDWTLEQALPFADKVRGVIVPCDARGLQKVKDDPRLTAFFSEAHANHALFVTGRLDSALLFEVELVAQEEEKILEYPDSSELVAFARSIVPALAGHQ
jgi:hypothetical protein